ncbi:hypothetical protein [Ruminococcus flavefaciens]|uniref:Uncharacterized protein n=1 Tax=Ruminococcus flavefaciens TaxID=1265 RepID=A0A1K1N093_RUMFL|nr:hypothetical protein [Ruminococcus flavefaciens]SFW28771.1 hypothetical protein SAMN02910280_1568 [Ruminococcus flavefaciens]
MTQANELGYNRSVRSQEFAHNRTLYNRVQKVRSKLIFFYIAPLAVYLPTAIFMGLISYVVAGALDALIVVPIAAYLAWKGCYRYHDFSLMALIGVLVINQLLLMFLSPYENKLFYDFNIFGKFSIMHLVLLAIVGTAAVINLKINITYHKLEEADGFPQFNERFFDQEMDIKQYGIKDPYQQMIDDRKRTASDSMSDVVLPQSSPDGHIADAKQGTMDEL